MTTKKQKLLFEEPKSLGRSSDNSSYNADLTHPNKQQLHLVLDSLLLKKFISAAHNGNNVILYYPMVNITDLLTRSRNCKIFSSLDLRSMPEAKLKTAFATTRRKWHWNLAHLEYVFFAI